MKQIELAQQLGISRSYLSMILSGQRKCPLELGEKLQSIPGVHKIVNHTILELASHARGHWFKSSTAHFLTGSI